MVTRTLTVTLPVRAGAIAEICVLESTVNDVAGVLPKVTDVAPVKFVPVSTTVLPPAAEPVPGLTVPRVGAEKYVNETLLLVPFGVTTLTWTVPAEWAGEVTVICVSEFTVKAGRLLPKLTLVAPVNPEPVSVTTVPPPVGPPLGLIEVIDT